jgi:hypothetical protein
MPPQMPTACFGICRGRKQDAISATKKLPNHVKERLEQLSICSHLTLAFCETDPPTNINFLFISSSLDLSFQNIKRKEKKTGSLSATKNSEVNSNRRDARADFELIPQR